MGLLVQYPTTCIVPTTDQDNPAAARASIRFEEELCAEGLSGFWDGNRCGGRARGAELVQTVLADQTDDAAALQPLVA